MIPSSLGRAVGFFLLLKRMLAHTECLIGTRCQPKYRFVPSSYCEAVTVVHVLQIRRLIRNTRDLHKVDKLNILWHEIFWNLCIFPLVLLC